MQAKNGVSSRSLSLSLSLSLYIYIYNLKKKKLFIWKYLDIQGVTRKRLIMSTCGRWISYD
jgi:hypothetical protein